MNPLPPLNDQWYSTTELHFPDPGDNGAKIAQGRRASVNLEQVCVRSI